MQEPFSEVAWECDSDSVVFEYGPLDEPKGLKLITPQSSLIDEICSKALDKIYLSQK